MERARKRSNGKFKRLPIEQHRELLLDPTYRHKMQASKKERLYVQQEAEFKKELRDYLNGKD